MRPIVLIQRTPNGDAFRYSRFGATRPGERAVSTDVVDTPTVKVGEPLVVLEPDDVEWLRKDPKGFFA